MIRVDVPFNDDVDIFQVTVTPSQGMAQTLTGIARQASGLDSYVDFDFSALLTPTQLADISSLEFGTVTPDANDFIVHSITAVAAPVPEPTTVAALGLGALAVLRRRNRR